jgi:hypothetical protein
VSYNRFPVNPAKDKDAPTPSLHKTLTKSEKQVARARAEALQARAEVVRAKAEAASAHEVNEQLRAALGKSEMSKATKFRFVASATAVLMVAALVKMAYVASVNHSDRHVAEPRPIAQKAAPVPLPLPPRIPHSANSASGVEFAKALTRLHDAFNSFPDEHQMDIVREINEKNPGGPMACPLAWNDGEPALYVGGKLGRLPLSLSDALNQCATEVEKLRIERDRQLQADLSGTDSH